VEQAPGYDWAEREKGKLGGELPGSGLLVRDRLGGNSDRLFEQAEDFPFLGVAPQFFLGEDQPVVDGDLKDATAGGDQSEAGYIVGIFGKDFVRHPGGTR